VRALRSDDWAPIWCTERGEALDELGKGRPAFAIATVWVRAKLASRRGRRGAQLVLLKTSELIKEP